MTLPGDFVFRYVPSVPHEIKWFNLIGNRFDKSFLAFEQRHGLPHTNMRIIRQSFLDIVRERSGNNPRAVQRAAGHSGIRVQETNYTSDAARQRNDEQIGHLENLRARWIDTNGLVTPLGLTAAHQDWGATTPGFVCLDPLDSPQPRQTQGRLCTAFGACLTCSMAVVDLSSPHALVRLLQLKSAIQNAQADLDAPAWLTTWAPRLQKLEEVWLPAFRDSQVLDAAALLQLPDLPPLWALE